MCKCNVSMLQCIHPVNVSFGLKHVDTMDTIDVNGLTHWDQIIITNCQCIVTV